MTYLVMGIVGIYVAGWVRREIHVTWDRRERERLSVAARIYEDARARRHEDIPVEEPLLLRWIGR